MDGLPDEMLAEVLRRLPPRYLAVCRTVCRYWHGVIDARGLLRAVAHLLPRPLRGMFIRFFGEVDHGFFSRPAARTSPAIDTSLHFLPGWWKPRGRGGVLDHSNGLLLYEIAGNRSGDFIYVCNPATRRWATLPSPPGVRRPVFFRCLAYLVFDPTVTLHYSVVFFPDAPTQPIHHDRKRNRSSTCAQNVSADYEHELNRIGSMEWPPYSYAVQVFSSTTGRWEEKHFIRVGDPVVTVADVWADPSPPTSCGPIRRYAVYWQQALYLHCRGGFIIRLSMLEQKYLVIRTPDTIGTRPKSHEHGEGPTPHVYLGKSKLGVYYTAIRGYQIQVWVLHEASELRQTAEWELKHQSDLEPSFLRHYNRCHLVGETNKSWILNPSQKESQDMGESGWDSSDDDVVDDEEEGAIGNNGRCVNRFYGIDLLGYHPSKEIAFLGDHLSGFAYNLDNAKLERLGSLCQMGMSSSSAPTLRSFIYTPCLYDQLPARCDDE